MLIGDAMDHISPNEEFEKIPEELCIFQELVLSFYWCSRMCHFVECFFDSLAAIKLSDSASFFLIKITKTILSDDPVIVRKIACI